jgi:hypothetical protein
MQLIDALGVSLPRGRKSPLAASDCRRAIPLENGSQALTEARLLALAHSYAAQKSTRVASSRSSGTGRSCERRPPMPALSPLACGQGAILRPDETYPRASRSRLKVYASTVLLRRRPSSRRARILLLAKAMLRTSENNWTPDGSSSSCRVAQKTAICRHITRGERGDSNPRPPGPQEGSACSDICRKPHQQAKPWWSGVIGASTKRQRFPGVWAAIQAAAHSAFTNPRRRCLRKRYPGSNTRLICG